LTKYIYVNYPSVNIVRAYKGSRGKCPLILYLDTRWPLYQAGKNIHTNWVCPKADLDIRGKRKISLLSGFHREVDENYALQGCYTESSGNFLLTFRDNRSVASSESKNPKVTLRMGPDRSSRNVGKKFPLLSA